ncbi:hypothetical protein BJ122_1466 [Rhodopseudomonas faecalis]|uniref:Uncharacterized protein n=1 Tax=Rhodopseudomonas faecalis TaxID=99655 RepID=A0A318T6P3_9BRAD|nr:hypothetical protein [Rhodopseudomonas faecalis]PYE99016.1 hypothetical protein BJ122_1466 [Rhodopseudomonas faecalis]
MRVKKYVIGLVLTATTLTALAVLQWTPILSSERNASGPVDLIAELHARFDPKRPGFGAADYPGNAAVHIPKSYAAILLAEVERSRGGLRPDLPNLAIPAGTWLLDHANLDGDGHPGWGVPIAWDAYGDGSINPANTAYTISTAIVVDALLTWMERDSSSPQKRIFETVTYALKPFADKQYRSPSGMLPYSFRKSDQPYDTFNPAAYMAGQLQRFSQLTPDQDLATALRNAADDTVQVLLNEKKVNPATGSWYWQYSIQENVANDLPHASYIIDGLRTYIVHGGRLADQIDINAAFAHLKEFEDKSAHYVRGWPLFQQNIDRPARTYDLGMAMSIACTTPDTAPIADVFLAELPKYRDNRNGYLKYPKGSEYASPLIVNEYEAYLYRGAIDCRLLAERKRSASFAIDFVPIDTTPHPNLPIAAPGAGSNTIVPFVRPSKTSASNVRYNQDTATFSLGDADSTSITFDKSLPIADHLIKGRRAIFTRHLDTNRLSLVTASTTGERISEIQITHSDGSEPIFRASTIAADQLILVYYDNISLNNYLVQYRIDQDGAHPQHPPLRLPLLQDPAGGTYEMIPPVFLLEIDARQLAVVGGTLVATLSLSDGSLSERRIDNCLRAVEAVSSADGAVVLCQKRHIEETEATFFVDAPPSLKIPRYEPDQLPYNLRVQDGSIVSEFATDGDHLQAMLRFDLERSQQNGWMEFGTNNDEGRIPWSQIYYLNGMLDFLRLSAISSQPLASADLLSNIRTRLDLEMKLIDQYWRDTRIATRGFTVDRSPAVFAVQTSRLLLLSKHPASHAVLTFWELRSGSVVASWGAGSRPPRWSSMPVPASGHGGGDTRFRCVDAIADRSDQGRSSPGA